jgi:hypothetical protein
MWPWRRLWGADMQTHKAKRVEIIIEAPMERRLTER